MVTYIFSRKVLHEKISNRILVNQLDTALHPHFLQRFWKSKMSPHLLALQRLNSWPDRRYMQKDGLKTWRQTRAWRSWTLAIQGRSHHSPLPPCAWRGMTINGNNMAAMLSESLAGAYSTTLTALRTRTSFRMRKIFAIRRTLPRLLTKGEPLSVIHDCQHQTEVTSTPISHQRWCKLFDVLSCIALGQPIFSQARGKSFPMKVRKECTLINSYNVF